MENIDRRKELTFRGSEFIIEVKADGQNLKLSAEQKTTGRIWRNQFRAMQIQDLSKRTGNFKRFGVFLRMLMTAIQNSTESVFIDLLTHRDLQILKSRNSQTNSLSSSSSNPQVQNTRYVILTYTVQFDRIHYPLRLFLDENPTPEQLMKTIERLSKELQEVKRIGPNMIDPMALLRENQELKQQVKKLEHNQNLAAVPRRGAVEIDSLIHDKKALEEENERVRLESAKQIKQLKTMNGELQSELERMKKEIDGIIDQLEADSQQRAEIQQTQNKLKQLQKQLQISKKNQAKTKEELVKSQNELDQLKQQDRKQKQRIKQLQQELQTALKNRNGRTYSGRLSSPSSSRPNTGPRSPATRSPNTRTSRSPATRSPNTRSPNTRSGRLGTPPSRVNTSSSNASQSSAGRRPNYRNSPGRVNSPQTRNQAPTRGRIGSPGNRQNSPGNRQSSPGNRATYGSRGNQPGVRQRTPPQRTSPGNRRVSPNTKEQRQKSPQTKVDVSDIEERLSKLQSLIKYARS